MARKHTASFILELPMKTDPGDERTCAIILDAGRNIGNAVLGEGLHRLDSGITSSQTGRGSGGISIPPFLPVSSWITVRCDPVRQGLDRCGSVHASGVERIRTCEREGLCLSSRHSWRQSGSLEKIPCQSPRGRFASVESPRERRSTTGSLWPSG
jgi:hypothetical protein